MLTEEQIQEIKTCAALTLAGKTLLYPTDTVWGIGCDATNFQAVEEIYRIKGRSEDKPLLVLVNSIEMIKKYKSNLSEIEISQLTFPEPTTVILENVSGLPNNISSEDKGIGFRITAHPFCSELMKITQRPFVSSSANLSGDPFPKSRSDINPHLIAKCNYLVNQFETLGNKPSRIVQCLDQKIVIIRK